MGPTLALSFFSPALRALIDELEPGVHRYFEVNIATDMPVNGKTDHGVYCLLRDPPVIDCLLFPETQTRKGRKGIPWSKEDDQKVGGWGAGIEEPAFIDKQKVEGHHMWLTKTGNNRSDLDLTWSDELVARYCAGKFSPPTVGKVLALTVV